MMTDNEQIVVEGTVEAFKKWIELWSESSNTDLRDNCWIKNLRESPLGFI